jgi:hypothetical protein
MGNPPIPVFNLTLRYNGRTNVIFSDIEISEAFDPRQLTTPPPVKKFECIWDTGATNSVINNKVVTSLGLKPVGKAEVHTAGGKRTQDTFLVNIKLPGSVGFSGVRVTEADLEGPRDILLGMDIIGAGDFAITNQNGVTCVSFRVPSLTTIDFTAGRGHTQQGSPQRISGPVQGRNDPCYCGSGKKYKHCHGK